jgi:hypothetical protein
VNQKISVVELSVKPSSHESSPVLRSCSLLKTSTLIETKREGGQNKPSRGKLDRHAMSSGSSKKNEKEAQVNTTPSRGVEPQGLPYIWGYLQDTSSAGTHRGPRRLFQGGCALRCEEKNWPAEVAHMIRGKCLRMMSASGLGQLVQDSRMKRGNAP